MKKITLILAFIGMITLQGCSTNEDNDTISEVFEYTNVNFLPNDYTVTLVFPHSIYTSDMVLVYRLTGSYQGNDIWKLLPETYYFDDGTLDMRYDFNFTINDAEVKIEGYDLAGVSTAYTQNQILRVVAIPAYEVNKNSKVDFKDYNAVVKAYHINENKIIKVQ
ncbi:MAG TPA: hypothetical protein PKN96_00535 [Flavobacterium sp.]|uniref:hypothetical protein n=1 Tax=Flavobacterium sp. TaxID=239 RepID=UPI002BB06697|nr:hypothetical protein [Flavobacterium sp.]HNP31757.1 hypothetical protein [Flavobacterium sp.]